MWEETSAGPAPVGAERSSRRPRFRPHKKQTITYKSFPTTQSNGAERRRKAGRNNKSWGMCSMHRRYDVVACTTADSRLPLWAGQAPKDPSCGITLLTPVPSTGSRRTEPELVPLGISPPDACLCACVMELVAQCARQVLHASCCSTHSP